MLLALAVTTTRELPSAQDALLLPGATAYMLAARQFAEWIMKRLALAALAATVLAFRADAALKPGDAAPDFVAQASLGGKEFTFFDDIFNIADAAICVGVIYIIVFQRKLFRRPSPQQAPTAG